MSIALWWRVHNAVKVFVNTILFAIPGSLVAPFFLMTAIYELAVDPVMLRNTGRRQMLVLSTVHHAFVFMWATAIVFSTLNNLVCDIHTLNFSIQMIALARSFVYTAVFIRRLRPVASCVVLFQFIGLMGFALNQMRQSDLTCGYLYKHYTMPCQLMFIFCFASYNIWLNLRNIGIIVVFKGITDDKPILRPIWVPVWASSP